MVTGIRRFFRAWLEWRLTTARLRVVAVSAAGEGSRAASAHQEKRGAGALPAGNLCAPRAV
jgi:hypothetical protein